MPQSWSWDELQLCCQVVPERYDLHLDLDPEHLDTFSGEVTMTLQVTSETPFITLNAAWR